MALANEINIKLFFMNIKHLRIKILVCLYTLSFLSAISFAQNADTLKHDVYNINYYIDGPVTAALIATNYWGLKIVDKKDPLDSLTIIGLDANDINRFDRSATRQDADYAPKARRISDFGMYGSYTLPLLLLADADIRKDWLPLMVLYLETVGKMHTSHAGNKEIEVPLVQMNALMGLLSDLLADLVLQSPLDDATKSKTLKAFQKLLWIQNDFINRHYVEHQETAQIQ